MRDDQRHPGEPMSALSRAAVDNHKHAKIEKGDTVVLSSRIIPGNEKAIYRHGRSLVRREAFVIYDDGSYPPIHVSGHASQEELKLIINLVRPKYFIPIHGEYPPIEAPCRVAASMTGAVGKSNANRNRRRSGNRRTRRPQGRTRQHPAASAFDSGSRTDVVEESS